MNERIKFRAYVEDFCLYNEDGDKYKKSFMINNVSAFREFLVGIYVEDFENQLKEQGFSEYEIEQIEDYCSEPCEDYLNIDVDKIEQCTGLKDKNEKLVFEGDIVFVNGEKWRVIWSDEDCAFFFSNLKEVYHQPIFPDFYMMTGDFEVIGNEHTEGQNSYPCKQKDEEK